MNPPDFASRSDGVFVFNRPLRWLHWAMAVLIFAAIGLGVALLGLAEMGTEPVNHAKFGIKIAITVVVLLISWPRRRDQEIPSGTYHAVGILALTNVAIAVFVK